MPAANASAAATGLTRTTGLRADVPFRDGRGERRLRRLRQDPLWDTAFREQRDSSSAARSAVHRQSRGATLAARFLVRVKAHRLGPHDLHRRPSHQPLRRHKTIRAARIAAQRQQHDSPQIGEEPKDCPHSRSAAACNPLFAASLCAERHDASVSRDTSDGGLSCMHCLGSGSQPSARVVE